ncbi:MAG: hypothetical protein AB7V58_15370 [Solirubrobacterales bacterium]
METRSYEHASAIREAERDFKLELDQPDWLAGGRPMPALWTPDEQSRWLERRIAMDGPDEEPGPNDIQELLLRFPSAPIHGLHRLHEYHVNEGQSENLHSYRVLLHPDYDRQTQIRRIYLMHNGLNETQSMGLYYKLASYLIHQDDEQRGTACILRPFPGHLTRSRFAGFAETPLDHYLWDGSHLFRQFLRYMIETRWLLSALARRSTYRCISGLNLLKEADAPPGSRLEDEVLADAIWSDWEALYRSSDTAVEEAHSSQQNAVGMKESPDPECFSLAVSSLRAALHLTARLGGELRPGDEEQEPDVHVIGYSLGGFTAQSVFMSWPFLIASCSTLLSGGALRELAPTAFANPEEWQTVLHSLRYELDDAMLTQRYKVEGEDILHPERISGIDFDLFLCLKSTFYEVFEQEYKGSYQTRLAAFRRRMLFIVGGNDPIVRPRSVLDSGPPDGINMFAIGGLGHFLGSRSRDDEEEQQRSFWLPEMGRLIDTLANEAAQRLNADRSDNWLDSEMQLPNPPTVEAALAAGKEAAMGFGRLSASERMAMDSDGVLSAPLFQRCLDDLLWRTEARRGILFLLRNEVPTALLDDAAIQQLAAGLHHHDAGIAGYVEGLRHRKALIRSNPERISLIVPWNLKKIIEHMDAHPGHPSQSEGAGGQIPNWVQLGPEDIWSGFLDTCTEFTDEHPYAVRVCDGRIGVDPAKSGRPLVDTAALARVARRKLEGEERETRVELEVQPRPRVKPSIPDCWVWMSPECLGREPEEMLTVEEGRQLLCETLAEKHGDEKWLGNRLRRDQLRIVTVSRARYNPRFRGQLVVDPRAAKSLLLHITLCIAISMPFRDYDLENERPRDRAPAG